jgi:hypothetical protein
MMVVSVTCQCGHQLTVTEVRRLDYNYSTEVIVQTHKCTERPPAPSIDHLVEENKKILDALHKKFLKWDDVEKHWMCECPICRSLELGGDCQHEH